MSDRVMTEKFNAEAREESVRSKTRRSFERFQRAHWSLAGGVASAVRRNARPYPLYFDHGSGSRAFDVDGNAYLDYGLAWGPLILGQAPPEITRAITGNLHRWLKF